MAARGVQLSNRSVAIVGRATRADVAELVDAHGSGPCGGNPVEVRVLSSALAKALQGATFAGRPTAPAPSGHDAARLSGGLVTDRRPRRSGVPACSASAVLRAVEMTPRRRA